MKIDTVKYDLYYENFSKGNKLLKFIIMSESQKNNILKKVVKIQINLLKTNSKIKY